MGSKFKLSDHQIQQNITALKQFMQKQGMDYFYVSSFDPYMNEYVPISDCHRFYFTNFTGSVAEVLVPVEGKVRLYVDGRYHEQADLECDLSQVEVIKVGANKGVLSTLKEDIDSFKPSCLGLEMDRTAYGFFKKLSDEGVTVKGLSNQELNSIVQFEAGSSLPEIKMLDSKYIGRTTGEKLDLIFEDKSQAYFVTAIDSLAWITNSRGYHIPFSSAFLGTGLLTHDKAYIFVDSDVTYDKADDSVEFISTDQAGRDAKLKELQAQYKFETVFYDQSMLNAQLFTSLEGVFGKALENKNGGIIEWQSIKEEKELDAFRESFQQSSQAIFNTIKWVKDQVAAGNAVSELDVYNKTTEMYNAEGAVTQSFNTISGRDANGSLIHYGDPKADAMITEDSMVLLDSGGYFDSGFATDTTRTFMGSSKAGSQKQKEIYTLTLKGTLNLQNAIFKPGTRGGGLDAIARQPLYQAGYDYNHGTGHGVGIHVHEGGAGISPVRNYLLKPGQIISIEPGIYIPGFGGVRIENIGIVKEHPEFEGFLCFENLVSIGYDPQLIDESLLNEQEKGWLQDYEKDCAAKGRSFL